MSSASTHLAAPSAARHVVIAGAGFIGLASAIEALAAGWQVTLVDPGPSGGEQAASYGNAGWLSSHSILPPAGPGVWRQVPGFLADPLGPLAIRWAYLPRALPWLWRYVRSGSTRAKVAHTAHALRTLLRDAAPLHEQLAQRAGARHLIARQGLLHVYPTRQDFEADALAWQLRRQEGIDWTVLDEAELRAREPDLAPGYHCGVLVPEAGHCRNPGAYAAALASHAQALGARRVTARATGLRLEHGRLRSVRTDQGELRADALVIAAGAYSAPLARAAGDAVCLDTERGYHVTLAPQAGQAGPRTPTMVMDRKLIVHQMDCGLRVAGQVEIAGLDAAPDWRRAEVLRRHLAAIFPTLSPAQLKDGKVWMGRRPSTPDGLPCIGRASSCPDVIHAYGHGHVGLGSSARTGRLVAQLLQGQEPEIELAPFSPQRFGRAARPAA